MHLYFHLFMAGVCWAWTAEVFFRGVDPRAEGPFVAMFEQQATGRAKRKIAKTTWNLKNGCAFAETKQTKK